MADTNPVPERLGEQRWPIIAIVVSAHAAMSVLGGVAAGPIFLSAIVISTAVWWFLAPPSTPIVTTETKVDKSPDLLPGEMARTVLNAFPDPVLVVNAEGRIERTNPALNRLFEQAREGRLLSSVIRAPAVLDAVKEANRSAQGETVDFATSPPDERWFKAFVVPFRLSDGTGYTLIALHDLTASMRVEQVRVDFIANASHELRTPLASLSGFIETLQGPARGDVEAQERFLEIMGKQTERMKHLIEDLLSLSRIEFDEHVQPSETVDIENIVRGVADGLEPLARANKVAITISAIEDLPKTIGAPYELAQVFQNLMDNAVKYGRDGGKVDVRLSLNVRQQAGDASRSFIRVGVTDFGQGIPREDLPRLTERFYRVDPEKSRTEGGTGLGLAIVKHIVNRHRGRLEVESQIGKGSTFSVLLPVLSVDTENQS